MIQTLQPMPSIDWGSTHMDGENFIAHLNVREAPLHLLVIPREVLEDGIRSTDANPMRIAVENRAAIEAAATAAWQRDELREVFELTGHRRNVQLWIATDDFPAAGRQA